MTIADANCWPRTASTAGARGLIQASGINDQVVPEGVA